MENRFRRVAAGWALVLAACQAPGRSTTEPPGTAALERPPEDVARAVRLEPFLTGLKEPLALGHAPGDPAKRLFVVEKGGRVLVVRNGQVAGTPFLDISDRVSTGSEQGLLGLAFHPRFAENRRVFINFTDRAGDTRVVELAASESDPDRADLGAWRELLFLDQPYANHNGGDLVFGPDGRLYIGTGDGGSANDPQGRAQDPSSLFGKMLRVDVDAKKPLPEIVALGLRNPWRYAFDFRTGDLYIADVGQNRFEEVDVVAGRDLGGQNFGWNLVEGMGHCVEGSSCEQSGLVLPVLEYGRDDGCSITGGHVYRGRALPVLDGQYFYSDFCSGLLRSFRWSDGHLESHWDWKAALDPQGRLASISSFGEDAEGELYLLSLQGTIYRFVPGAPED